MLKTYVSEEVEIDGVVKTNFTRLTDPFNYENIIKYHVKSFKLEQPIYASDKYRKLVWQGQIRQQRAIDRTINRILGETKNKRA